MRTIIVHIATSADGYIARPDGIPLIAPQHRLVPLRLHSAWKFPDGAAHLHDGVTRRP
ncbi:MAG TPA: hypothetical protein VGX46_00095 [Vicinamibacterales bacterium]|jgi:hypothetical protein|nr:hypothetical protein [Vicinamibacterales bacterium]